MRTSYVHGPKALATLESDGAVLKIVSKTDKGEVVKTMTLRDDGKELEVVSDRTLAFLDVVSTFVLLQDIKCDERGAHAKRFFKRE